MAPNDQKNSIPSNGDSGGIALAVLLAGAVLLVFALMPILVLVPGAVFIFIGAALLYVGAGIYGFATNNDENKYLTPSQRKFGIIGFSMILVALCPEYWGHVATYSGGMLLTVPLVWLASQAVP